MENNELNEEIVRLAYRLVLGRSSENQNAIQSHIALRNIENLRKTLINSAEFKDKFGVSYESEECKDRVFVSYENEQFKILHSKLSSKPIETFIETKNDLLILQTCDRENYLPMLQHTSLTVLAYIKRHGCNYETFIGLKRGVWPWHATFNRIYKLNDYIESGYKGWVLYMDADAYFCNFDFDLLSYLSDKQKYAFVLAHTGITPNYYDINAGVFFANLGHPVCVNIIRRWKGIYDRMYKDEDYARAIKWNMISNDQSSFVNIIRYNLYKSYLYIEGTGEIFNSGHAKVIRQILRKNYQDNCLDTLEQRTATIASDVRKALATIVA